MPICDPYSVLFWEPVFSLRHLCEFVLKKLFIMLLQNFVDCGVQTMLTVL